MRVRTIASAVGLAAIIAAGCMPPAGTEHPAPAAARGGTVLILQGTAFQQPAARDAAVRVVADSAAGSAHAIADDPPFERVTSAASATVERSLAAAARVDARDVACRKRGRSVATAVAERADVVVRIRLDARTTTRPSTDADRADLAPGAGLWSMLMAVTGARTDTVYETTLDGTLERTTFPGAISTERRSVRWIDHRLGDRDEPPRVEVEEALRHALAGLPAAAPTRWEPIARGLAAEGCPVLGLAVADVLVDDPAAQRRIRAAARAALQGDAKREEARDSTTDAPDNVQAAGPPGNVAPAATTEPAYSCATLCSLHMIELCNNDRTLWSQHGSRWENTRCGARRSEPFLADCYRMQWLSGTYERACVRPCEADDDGRLRLLGMLRRSGCLRAGS